LNRRLSSAAPWLLAGVVAFPIAVLSHELAHYLAYRLFDVPGVTLHFGSVSAPVLDLFWERVRSGDRAGAAALVLPWQVTAAAGAGLVATYMTLILCCIGARVAALRPWCVAIGLVAPVRIASGIPTLLAYARAERLFAGTDEGSVAQFSGIPPLLPRVNRNRAAVGRWTMLIRSIPRGTRTVALVAVLAGICAGGVLYAKVVGPALLP